MSSAVFLPAFLVSLAVTFALRSLPFLAFAGRPMPRWMQQLGEALPAAIMAVLIVYCLKDSADDWIGIGLPKLAGVLVTALSWFWKHSTFFSIIAGTVTYMGLLALL